MILLGIFEVLWWFGEGLFAFAFDPLPAAVGNILTYLFQLIDGGFSFVFQVLCDKTIAVAVAGWILTATGVFFLWDLTWRLVNLIKLRHEHIESN